MNVLMADCEFRSCAMRVCGKLRDAGVAASCEQTHEDTLDNAEFTVPSAGAKKDPPKGLVMCEPNAKVFAMMTEGLRKGFGEVDAAPACRHPGEGEGRGRRLGGARVTARSAS
jgi:hypothetical protein